MNRVVVAGRVYRKASPDKIPTLEEVLEYHGSEVKRIVKDRGSGDGYEDEILSEMEDRYEEAVYNVKQGFEGQSIWRAMQLSRDIDPASVPHLGIYWSFEEDAAEAHWGGGRGKGNVEWVYEAVIDDLAVVNKAASIYAYTCPACGADEMEVTLKEGLPLRVLEAGGYSAEVEFEESEEAEDYDFDPQDPEFGKWMTI